MEDKKAPVCTEGKKESNDDKKSKKDVSLIEKLRIERDARRRRRR